jgi:DNA-directed RNA polymerase subunit RPC12/RpoP
MARQQSRPGAYEPPQSNFSQPPGAPPSRGPGGPDQAAFPGGAGAAGLPPAGVTAQIFTCKKCGYTAEIPPVSKSMKVKCQNCGAKTTVKPLPKAKAAKGFKLPGASGGGPPKILFLLVFIIIIAALVLFVGPSVLGFPDLLSGILP